MKRCMILLLVLLLLAGCLPTPEQEYVINKSDNVLEEKLSATPVTQNVTIATPMPNADDLAQSAEETRPPATGSASEPVQAPLREQFFPARYDEEAEPIRDYVTLAFHADVVTRADGLYPVYRTRQEPFTQAQVIDLANKLLSQPKERQIIDGLTKAQWAEQLQAYLDEVAAWEEWVQKGKPNDGVDRDETGYDPAEVEKEIAWFKEQYQSAPEKLDKAMVSDYADYQLGQIVRYTLADGGYATIASTVNESWNEIILFIGCRNDGSVYGQRQYQDDKKLNEAQPKRWVKQWKDSSLSRKEGEAIAYRELLRLGFEGFKIACGEPANLYDTTETSAQRVSTGWSFTLRRDFDGYPLVDKKNYKTSDHLELVDSKQTNYNKRIRKEAITLFVDVGGIQYFCYSGQKAIVGKETANVALLPFEEIVRILKNTMKVCYPSRRFQGEKDHPIGLEIYRMVLTPYTLRVKDSDDFYEVPCWVAFFDGWRGMKDREAERQHGTTTPECVVINAVDGTIVHEKSGR